MTDPGDPDYFREAFAENRRKRAEIIAQAEKEASTTEERDWLVGSRLYEAGLISVSEYHACGSLNVLPRGWYYWYLEGDGYVPARVWSLEEARKTIQGDDRIDVDRFYQVGYRFVSVFTERSGPDGESEAPHLRSFEAETLTENPISQEHALEELEHFGYTRADLLPSAIIRVSDAHGPA